MAADDEVGYEGEAPADGYGGYGRREPSPPHASGGFYNPPPPPGPIPVNGYTQHPNVASTNLHNLNQQQYTPYPPSDQGFSPHHPPVPPQNPAMMTGGIPPPITPTGPEHVSEASRVGRSTPDPEPEPEAAVRSVNANKEGASSLGGAGALERPFLRSSMSGGPN